jgi:hypothetical protein
MYLNEHRLFCIKKHIKEKPPSRPGCIANSRVKVLAEGVGSALVPPLNHQESQAATGYRPWEASLNV